MKIQNRFIYKLTDRVGTIVVEPLGESDFTLDYDLENDEKIDYKKQLSGKLTFKGKAFERLMLMENSVYRCDEQNLSIFKMCNDFEKIIFSGSISLNEAEFNLDKCFITLKFLEDSKDKCIDDNKSLKLNLFNFVTGRKEVGLTNPGGVIQLKECYQSSMVNEGDNYRLEYWCGTGDPDDGNWVIVENRVTMDGSVSGNPTGGLGGLLSVRTYWAREVLEVDCGSDVDSKWILIEDNCGTSGKQKYAKPVDTYDCKDVTRNFKDAWNFNYRYLCKYLGGEGESGEGIKKLKNGIMMNDSIVELVKNACPGLIVKSDFFQINPDNVSTTNYVTGKKSTVNEIIIFQKSDVKRPIAQNISTKLEFDLETMLETLLTMFNVKWRIDGVVFRLEHISYFAKTDGLDVTIQELKKFFNGKRSYSYQNESIPRKEKFKFKEQGSNRDYILDIEYVDCVTNKKKNEVNNIVEDVMTDIPLCLANPASDSKVVEDSGAVFISTKKINGEYFVNSEASANGRFINNVFAWVQLFKAYHYFNRPIYRGLVNGIMTNFITTIPTKKGERFAIPLNLCTTDFNPDKFVKTALGKGIVSTAKYRFKDSFLELELLYESNQNLIPNQPPELVGGGVFSTYKNTPKTLYVTATDGDGFVSALLSPQPPLNGTLNFISISEFEFVPNNDFIGDAYFSIQAIDNYSEVSNIVNYVIRVLPPNQPPIARDDSYNVYHGEVFNQGTSIFANDSDDHGFTLVNSNLTTVQGVNVIVDSGGFFNYTPPSGFEGSDSFQYQIKDDQGLTSTATVTLVVRFKNKPIAVNDFYQTLKDSVFTTDGTLGKKKLTANDYAPDGVSYAFTTFPESKTTSAGGSVNIGNDGNFTYTPPSGFLGKDSFGYTVLNVNGSGNGVVEISVIPTIYVELKLENPESESIIITCGDPPSSEIGGQIDKKDVVVYFYADSNKTIPFDVTGLDFKMKIQEKTTISHSTGSPTILTDNFETSVLSGTSTKIIEKYDVFEENRNCSFQLVFKKEVSFSVLNGAYIVI